MTFPTCPHCFNASLPMWIDSTYWYLCPKCDVEEIVRDRDTLRAELEELRELRDEWGRWKDIKPLQGELKKIDTKIEILGEQLWRQQQENSYPIAT